MSKKILVALIGLMLIGSLCFAETSEWKDQKFDFKTVKTILYGPPSVAKDIQDRFAGQKAADALLANFNETEKKTPIRFVALQSVVDAIGRDLGIDMNALKQKDFQQFKNLFVLHSPKYCDAILTVEVISLGYGKVHRDASFSANTSTQTDTYVVNGSMYDVTGPSTNFKYSPPHDVTIVNGGITLSLISLQTGNVVWGVTDVRDRTNKMLSKTSPDDMLKRIIDANIDKLVDKFISSK